MPSPTRAQYFRILHLDPCKAATYTASDLRHAYLRRAKAVHPDKHPDDPDATRMFQEVSRAYTTLCRLDGGESGGEGDDAEDIDLDKYRRIYETLSDTLAEKASAFWETSAEAKVLKMLWQSWRGDAHRSDNSDGSDSETTSTDSDPTDIPFPDEQPDEQPDEPDPATDAPDQPPPLRIPLPLPLYDVYHNVPHKVHYTRYRWSAVSGAPEPEEQTVLIPAGCRQMTCYGEGDQLSEGGASGDVVFDVEPVMSSDRYRLDSTQLVLERWVALTPNEICYGTVVGEGGACGEVADEGKVVDVCGEAVVVRVPPGLHIRWGAGGDGNVMVVVGRGLVEEVGESGGESDSDTGAHRQPHQVTRGALRIVFDVVPNRTPSRHV